MLAVDVGSTSIMYNALKDDFHIEKVIIENRVSKKRLIRNRIKRLGYLKVFGQVLFMLFNNKILLKLSKSRIDEIKNLNNLDDSAIPNENIMYVNSINDDEVIKILKKENPDAVVVNGTRIISGKVLSSINRPFINTHVGITPKYRGVNGGYWALVNNDLKHCGVTVHLVDNGIDTGGVIFQDTISITKEDSFNTYGYHQVSKAVPLMKKALIDVGKNNLQTKNINLPSILWYHPTLLEYITNYLKQGVK